jgi:hypothetical protein
MHIEIIIYYLILIDSIGCNLIVWLGEKWYTKHFRWLSRFFPPAKGWALYYLILIIWIGSLLYRAQP